MVATVSTEAERERAWMLVKIILAVLTLLVFAMLVVMSGFAYIASRTNDKVNHLTSVQQALSDQAALSRCRSIQNSEYAQDQWTTLWQGFQNAFNNNDPEVARSIASALNTKPGANGEPIADRIRRNCSKEIAAVNKTSNVPPLTDTGAP